MTGPAAGAAATAVTAAAAAVRAPFTGRSRGSGLSGLAQRVAVVDGRLDITSPPGGPTRITVELPLRAG